MKKKQVFVYGLLAVILTLAFIACSGSGGGGKSLNSATELKEYLDKQPANSPDKPIKVAMKANEMMIKDIAKVIREAGKYVSLNLSGSPLTEIPPYAFYYYDEMYGGYKTLVEISIPNSVTSIGEAAFSRCENLTSIIVETNNPNYSGEGGVLYNKNKTTLISYPSASGHVTIPNSVTSIGESVFLGCTSLTSVKIPNSVTSIGSGAFSFNQLTSVKIPNSVISIGNNAFSFNQLTSVTFEGTISSDNFAYIYGFEDLRAKYLAGGIGTYTRPNGSDTWTKQ